MLLNNPRPPLTWLCFWISAKGRYSYSRCSICSSCSRLNQLLNSSSHLTSTRTGSVLINTPTSFSIPFTSPGRPATVAPNPTSRFPLYLPNNTLHIPCTTVFSVTCSRRLHLPNASVLASLNCSTSSPAAPPCSRFSSSLPPPPTLPLPSPSPHSRLFSTPSTVAASTPFSFSRQNSTAFPSSFPCNHFTYSPYPLTSPTFTSPPSHSPRYTANTSSNTTGNDHPSSTR